MSRYSNLIVFPESTHPKHSSLIDLLSDEKSDNTDEKSSGHSMIESSGEVASGAVDAGDDSVVTSPSGSKTNEMEVEMEVEEEALAKIDKGHSHEVSVDDNDRWGDDKLYPFYPTLPNPSLP